MLPRLDDEIPAEMHAAKWERPAGIFSDGPQDSAAQLPLVTFLVQIARYNRQSHLRVISEGVSKENPYPLDIGRAFGHTCFRWGFPMKDAEIKTVLAKIIETVDRLADETAELVDKYHRARLAEGYQQEAVDRANALTEASRNMRQAASTLLGIQDRQAKQGATK
jgi:hypothetical protein